MSSTSQPLLAALEFGSLSMLGWLAAAAIPWLIHRWFRRKPRTTPWAAVDLLLAALRQRSRRIKLQQWLLLAVRTAILVLVALAAAEPAFRQWAVGAGGLAPIHHIALIDRSYSMAARQGDDTRLELAKSRARRMIEASRTGDAFTILSWSQSTTNVMGRPTTDAALALSAIQSIKQSDGIADPTTVVLAIENSIAVARENVPQLAHHQVTCYTDLGRRSWEKIIEDHVAWESLAEQSRLLIVDVSDGRGDNLAVTDLLVNPRSVQRQLEATIAATLHNFGEQSWLNQKVALTIDGRPVEEQQIDLTAKADFIVSFKFRFVNEGPHFVKVALTNSGDCLPMDDRRWQIVDVRPPLRIACVQSQPQAAEDVDRALSFASDALVPEIVPAHLLGGLDFSHFAAVLLCDLAEFSHREAAQLTQYVWNGGGLAVLLGPRALAEQYNQLGTAGYSANMLPVDIGGEAPVGNYRFDPLGYGHPIVEPFRGRESAELLNVAVSQYRMLKPRPHHPAAKTVLAFNTGDPAMIVDDFGMGRLAVWATPGSLATRSTNGTPWSSLPVSPSFLPMVREMVIHLVEGRWLQQRNLLVNAPAICRLDPALGDSTPIVRLPDGSLRQLPASGAEDRGQLSIGETSSAGVYSASAADKTIAMFAVNLDTTESDLEKIDPSRLPVEFTTTSAAPTLALSFIAGDFSFVRSLLAGAVLLLLMESVLAWLMGRGWG